MRHDTTRPAGLSAGSVLRLARELSGMSPTYENFYLQK